MDPAAPAAPEDGALWRAVGGTGEPPAAPPRGFWRRVYRVDRAPQSQLDALARATAEGIVLPGPVASVAGSGEGFHGLRGRPWAAEPGNLHVALAIPLDGFPARDGLAFSLLPAVATVEAIRAASGGRVSPGLKWVNDLLVDGRKVAGILTTTRATGGRLDAVFLGIGVNLAVAPAVPPTPFVPAVGRVPGVDLEALLAAVLDAVARRHRELLAAGPGPLLAAYRARQVVVGRPVRVYREGLDDLAPPAAWPPPLATGVVRGIGDDLSLEIEGSGAPVASGRLAFEEHCAGLPR